MISVKIEGRLGNQLFQYAFIYNTAKKLNTKFYLDKSISSLLLNKYFIIKTDFCQPVDNYLFSITGFKNIFSHHLKRGFYNFLKLLFRLKEVKISNSISPDIQLKNLEDYSIYQGFFQSEQYFKDLLPQIHNILKIRDSYVTEFEEIIKSLHIPVKYVVVHIRRGDYVDCDWALDYNYFHKAIKSIHNDNNYYIFISDEPEIVENEFKYISHKYVSHNSEIIDFQFLNNADICILSNSSFSWWGAYLNLKCSIIIAPQYWLGLKENIETPVNIIPEKFTIINAIS